MQDTQDFKNRMSKEYLHGSQFQNGDTQSFESDDLQEVEVEFENEKLVVTLAKELQEAQDTISDLNKHIEKANKVSEEKKNKTEKKIGYLQNDLEDTTKQIEQLKTKLKEKRNSSDKEKEGEKVTQLEKQLDDQIASLRNDLKNERRTRDEEIEKMKNNMIEKEHKLRETEMDFNGKIKERQNKEPQSKSDIATKENQLQESF